MKYVFIIISILLVHSSAFANIERDTLPTDELQIVKDFDATLADFDKVDVSSPLPQLDTTRYLTGYSVQPQFLTLTYDAPSIKPIPLKHKSLLEEYSGYLKIGVGYPLAPYVEAAHQQQDEQLIYGGQLRYFNPYDWNQLEHQQFLDGDVSANATYQFDSGFSLGGDIGYEYDQRYFYGYDHDTQQFEAKDIKQYFSVLKNHISFQNTDMNSVVDYGIHTGFYYMQDNYKATEIGVRADAFVGSTIAEQHDLRFHVRNIFVHNNADSTQQTNVLSMIPSYTFHHDIFRIKAGVNVSMVDTEFRFLPDAEAFVSVFDNKISTFLGWKGYAEPTSFRGMTQYNPYIVSNPELRVREENFPYLGVKADFAKAQATLKGGYKMVKNQALYINDFANDAKRFAVVYDDINYITVSLEGQAEVVPHLDISLGIHYQNATLDSLVTNSHDIADLDVQTTIAYSALAHQKLTLGTTLFLNTGKPYITSTGEADNLPLYFDANVFAKYQINKRFNVFLNLNNITHQKYPSWNGYPNYGFNALLGVFWKWD